jgi:hypothetical protein
MELQQRTRIDTISTDDWTESIMNQILENEVTGAHPLCPFLKAAKV